MPNAFAVRSAIGSVVALGVLLGLVYWLARSPRLAVFRTPEGLTLEVSTKVDFDTNWLFYYCTLTGRDGRVLCHEAVGRSFPYEVSAARPSFLQYGDIVILLEASCPDVALFVCDVETEAWTVGSSGSGDHLELLDRLRQLSQLNYEVLSHTYRDGAIIR